MDVEDSFRVTHIMFGMTSVMLQLRAMRVGHEDAKIACRAALFVMEEWDRHEGMTQAQLEALGEQFAPEVVAFIKNEIELVKK